MTINTLTFSSQQLDVLERASVWLKTKTKKQQVYRIFGPAGTGKTTLAKYLAAQLDNDVVYAAYTAKAAMVMAQNGCDHASTIHSLIYEARLEAGKWVFTLDNCSQAADVKLIVIDECSMIDRKLARDLLSFKTPVLVLGDPAQLPPVSGKGYFIQKKPDVLLSEIHRQAAGNPILKLADDIRNGRPLVLGQYGSSLVVSANDLTPEDLLAADQVLVGVNSRRRDLNCVIRELRGFSSPLPMLGDRLVNLVNNPGLGYVNGETFTALADAEKKAMKMKLLLRCDDRPGTPTIHATLKTEDFLRTVERSEDAPRTSAPCFDYAYALTVHKAQGSQWRNVLVWDDSQTFKEDAAKWLYTAITRARESVKIVV